MQERSFADTHGVEIFTRWWLPDDPKALVVLAHGASEHSGRYNRFAEALNVAGIAAVALDHRGQGLTGRSTGAGLMGPGGGQALIDDLHQLRAQAQDAVGAVPTFTFGHSLGSLINLVYLTEHSAGLAGAVLCGHAFGVNDVAALSDMLQAAADQEGRDTPATTLFEAFNKPFEPARTPFDWLSRDQTEVDKYIADPLCGAGNPLTYGYLLDLAAAAADAPRQLSAISCPVLVIAGSEDSAGAMGAHPKEITSEITAAGGRARLKLYPEDRHEILNELDRDQVTADVVAWLENPQAP